MTASRESLDQQIARAMDCSVELLPHLPELLADLDSLGGDPAQIIGVLDEAGVPREIAALDLGCGKGALSVALARRGHRVVGVDGFEPFIESARVLAGRAGVDDRCRFRLADIRDLPTEGERFDLVALVSVGRPFGSLRETVGALRSMVSPGGWIVIEDSYRAGAEPVAGFADYDTFERTVDSICAWGDALIAADRQSIAESAHIEEVIQDAINRRAAQLMARHPDLRPALDEFLEQQRRLSDVYQHGLPAAVFLVRRAAKG